MVKYYFETIDNYIINVKVKNKHIKKGIIKLPIRINHKGKYVWEPIKFKTIETLNSKEILIIKDTVKVHYES